MEGNLDNSIVVLGQLGDNRFPMDGALVVGPIIPLDALFLKQVIKKGTWWEGV